MICFLELTPILEEIFSGIIFQFNYLMMTIILRSRLKIKKVLSYKSQILMSEESNLIFAISRNKKCFTKRYLIYKFRQFMRPFILTQDLNSKLIIVYTLLFFAWYGMTLMLSNAFTYENTYKKIVDIQNFNKFYRNIISY